MIYNRFVISMIAMLCGICLSSHAAQTESIATDPAPVRISLNDQIYPDILKKKYVGYGKMALNSALQYLLPNGLSYKLQGVPSTKTVQWDQTSGPLYRVLDQIADGAELEWHYREGLVVFAPIGAALEMDKPKVIKTNIAVAPKSEPVAEKKSQAMTPVSTSILVKPKNESSAKATITKDAGFTDQTDPPHSLMVAGGRGEQGSSPSSALSEIATVVTATPDLTTANPDTVPIAMQPRLKTMKHWAMPAGGMLSAAIEAWAKQWGWKIVWKVDSDFRIATAVDIDDDFLGGIEQVLDAYSATPHPLWGDAHESQKLLVITSADGSAYSLSSR